MAKGRTWKTVVAGGVLAGAGILSGCDDPNKATLNKIDVVNAVNRNAVGVQEIEIRWPAELVSDPQGTIIDLTDVKQVAKAMGVTLTGDPDQLLYKIEIGKPGRSSGRNSSGFIPYRERQVTVKTVKQGADLINDMEDQLVSGRIKELTEKQRTR